MTQPPNPALARAQRHLADIEAALGRSDMDRATLLASRAVKDGVSHPMLHNLLAHRHEQAGRFAEAVSELQRGLKLAPDDIQLLTALGFSLIQLEQRSDALDVFTHAVAVAPNFPPAHYGRGSAFEKLGELHSAGAEYQRAIELAPDYADAWSGLADLAERRRSHAESRALVDKALAIDPTHLDARLTLARLETSTKDFAGAEARIREVLTDPRLTSMARGNAQVLLGDAIDGQGRADEAWDAYVEGKAELGRIYAPMFVGPGMGTPTLAARRLAAEFRETDPADWVAEPDAAARDSAKSHAFLFGFARSGTTLLEQILATHPDVVALEERPTLHDAEIEFVAVEGGTQRLAALDARALEPFRQAYWKRVRGFGVEPRDKVFIDKFPLNTFKIPLMFKLCPEAKMLFALRDPRDVVVSCFRRSFRMNASMYQFTSLEGAARYYDAVMAAAVLYRERLPLQLHEIRYESLVGDFEGEARKICEFLDLPWTEALKDFAGTAQRRSVATPSATQVARGLYTDGMGQWRRYARQLEAVADILDPWIEYYGYSKG